MNLRQFFSVLFGAIALVLCVWKAIPLVLVFADMEISAIQQSSLHRKTYDTVLHPMCEWVREFRAKKGRMPTNEEASEYSVNHYHGQFVRVEPPERGTSGQVGTDFMVSVTVNDLGAPLSSMGWTGVESVDRLKIQ